MLTPFIDPVTRGKLKFNPDCIKEGYFEADMLVEENWGGAKTLDYVHEEYWPGLLKLTGEKREKHKERWSKLGGRIGVKEWDYKAETPVEEVGEKGEEKVETPVVVVAV